MTFKVLFICVNNACRSPMAEGFARKMGLKAESMGTQPAQRVTESAVFVMQERGIDISNHRPRRLERRILPEYDRVIIMGKGVKETTPTLTAHEDWDLPDPLGRDLATYRSVRDRIEAKVRALTDELQEWRSA